MKIRKLVSGIMALVLGLTVPKVFNANADDELSSESSSYTLEDIKNLQNFLLAKDTPDLSEKTMT